MRTREEIGAKTEADAVVEIRSCYVNEHPPPDAISAHTASNGYHVGSSKAGRWLFKAPDGYPVIVGLLVLNDAVVVDTLNASLSLEQFTRANKYTWRPVTVDGIPVVFDQLKIATLSTGCSGEIEDGAVVEVNVTARADEYEGVPGLISEARRRIMKDEESGEAQFCSGAVRWSTRHL